MNDLRDFGQDPEWVSARADAYATDDLKCAASTKLLISTFAAVRMFLVESGQSGAASAVRVACEQLTLWPADASRPRS
jgi:hypothetical protein